MIGSHEKWRTVKLKSLMLKINKSAVWLVNKRALSPIFATVLLATIIMLFGSVAYYYANNVTTSTTNKYISDLSNSQQSVAEHIGFENIVYSDSPAPKLMVYIINSGDAHNLKINSVLIYDSNHYIIGAYSGDTQISGLYPISAIQPAPTLSGNSLNIGIEAYFFVTLNQPSLITDGQVYTVRVITQSGSAFEYEFTA